ncbi:MAG: hypothetical protein KAQ99_10220 [Candidatus Aureabacteria bacterium]|nr:hypothetical protein [Candidatus Auribacterota bacterium]
MKPVVCPNCKQPNNCLLGYFNAGWYFHCIKCDLIIKADEFDLTKIISVYAKVKGGFGTE